MKAVGEWQHDLVEKVYKIYENGGMLYFIERTDTNQYASNWFTESSTRSNSHDFGQTQIEWKDTIDIMTLSGAYLTRKDAEKREIREGGCPCCGNGSEVIPTIVTEHEFIKPPKQ